MRTGLGVTDSQGGPGVGERVCRQIAVHGVDTLVTALQRALTFRRFTADDVRAIIAAGPDAPTTAAPGAPLTTDLPAVTGRSLDAYALDQLASGEVTS